jgi:pSer/pThr/pTyr-binding forkhead associated (FHA) protein
LHAQLRANRGRFMLFDLHSTGGTLVNGKRITATILYPGDVITLAGTTLVYGQRATRPLQEQPYETEKPHIINLNTTVTLRRSLFDAEEDSQPSHD